MKMHSKSPSYPAAVAASSNPAANAGNMAAQGVAGLYEAAPLYGAGYQSMPCQLMPNGLKLATAYVLFQQLNTLYSPAKGLKQGTIFPELDRPYGCDPEYTVDR